MPHHPRWLEVAQGGRVRAPLSWRESGSEGRARVGDATIEAPIGQLNHFICLLRQTERPTPPPGVMASNDCALDHEAA